ncbi:hypothetical protein LIER_38095 [Lithospermum erythrorhizon]|uniref:Uncharacterized protein n=1 Tax=Lithospermum erythrorhizon TaxID=34254 RepID=A0AAV3PUJ6_LITER
MGESACLLRTYSQPSSSSPKTKQGELFRCLTSSISLGRYMSESLDWQKSSTFTENRYMEDVKKYSRPGSVAQMKAHFEAHFKKKATKKATTSNEQQNLVSRTDLDKDLMQIGNHVTSGKTQEEQATSNMFSISVELEHVEDFQASRCNQNIEGREQDHTQFTMVENIEDDGKVACREDGKTHSEGIVELGDPASLEKRKTVFLPFKSRGYIGVPKPPAPPKPSIPIHRRQNRQANSGISGSGENAAGVKNRKAATRSLHMSIDLAPKVTKKTMSPILHRLVKIIARKADRATQGKPFRVLLTPMTQSSSFLHPFVN